jgi:uncharacterized protein (DUF58 family)
MILVRPTTRGKIMILGTAVAVGAALVNAGITTSLLAAGMSSVLLSSFVLSFFSIYRIKLKRGVGRDGIMGNGVMMPLTIINLSRRTRQTLIIREKCKFYRDKIHNTVVEPLNPRESREINRIVPACRRGSFELRDIIITGGDPAGFFFRERKFKLPDQITIYAESIRLSWLPISNKKMIQLAGMGRPVGIAGMGQEFFGVREYQPSDGVRFIHWKASAKQDKLMVREFEAQTSSRISIILDTDKNSFGNDELDNNFEYLVRIAATVSDYLASMYYQLSFISTYGEKNPVLVRESGLAYGVNEKIRKILSTIQPTDTNFLELLDLETEHCHDDTILYCLTMS